MRSTQPHSTRRRRSSVLSPKGRVIGKLLGDRHVSGDLTGLARVKFDVAGQRPQRFRLVYRQVDERTRDVLAIGLREEHAIYRLAARRITPSSRLVSARSDGGTASR
jgi:hypothetical protein